MDRAFELQRGATLLPDGSVRFSVWAPAAKSVLVEILSGPAAATHPMVRDSRGVWEKTVERVGAGADYRFRLRDDLALPDPASRYQPEGVHGPSRVVDTQFAWRDAEWRGVAMEDLVIYELHVGTFTDEGTFTAAIAQLPALRSLGITAIELMPVAQFPGDRNWGYDGVCPYAVQNAYGGPQGLRELVDAAHANGLAVILDVVYNHVGPEGNYLAEYGPYFSTIYNTPWGPTFNFDDAHSDEVRRYVVDNALYWATEYHIDGLRLDAVHKIYDMSATHILEEIASALHVEGQRRERHILAIAESDLNDPRIVRDQGSHGYGLDGQWSDDFHHAVHALLTGERGGYYADFGTLELLARAFQEPFVYHGQYSASRQRTHGRPSTGLPRERFVVAIQNHDQVGNRALGDRLSTLVSHDKLRMAAALLLLSPYVPLLFMGEEYAETRPFSYFVSHGDPKLVDAVRQGRKREFADFGWKDEIPDPQADETFRGSKLDRSVLGANGWQARMLELYRDLLAMRRDEPTLHPDGGSCVVEWQREGALTLLRYARAWRMGRTGALLAMFNCSDKALAVRVPEDANGAWSLRLSTDATSYGGAGTYIRDIPDDDPARQSRREEPKRLITSDPPYRSVTLPPWTAAVFERRDF